MAGESYAARGLWCKDVWHGLCNAPPASRTPGIILRARFNLLQRKCISLDGL